LEEARLKRKKVFMIELYNEKGDKVGSVWKRDDVKGNEYIVRDLKGANRVGIAKSFGNAGGKISCGKRDMFRLDAIVTENGNIYHDKNGIKFEVFTEKCTIKKGSEKKAEQIKAGKVEINNGIGSVYRTDGSKIGEVRDAGEDTLVFGGVLLALEGILQPEHLLDAEKQYLAAYEKKSKRTALITKLLAYGVLLIFAIILLLKKFMG
jgi:hypothetical protein